MKPPRFDYHAPSSLAEALELLARDDGDTAVIAGGQSLVPLLSLRLAYLDVLIDLSRIADLAQIEDNETSLAIGAMTRQRTVEESKQVRERVPILVEAVRHIGHPQIRNRGTVGGSIAHADPAAELPLICVLTDSRIALASAASGVREVSATDFFLGPFMTDRRPDEILTSIRLPRPPAKQGWAFEEVSRRHGDFALAAVGATVEIAADGTIASARLAVTAGGGGPLRVLEAEAALVGCIASATAFKGVAEIAIRDLELSDDLHASRSTRRKLTATLVQRALATATSRATGSVDE
jgi:CO/xanthine dehydrogenase FAD-binding subunit